MISTIVRGGVFAVAAVTIAGCSGGPPALTSGTQLASHLTASAAVSVKIANYVYSPKTVVIKAGTTLKFSNDDAVGHTVTAFNGSFKSPLIGPGKSWKHTFKTAGKFKYYCEIHPYMHGVVKVTQ